MPGRTFSATSAYRYGFNGKEQDSAINGTGVDYDYGARIYDARAGRFLSIDPLTRKYSMLTPYQFASNGPIDGLDLDGLEYLSFHKSMYRMEYQTMKSEIVARDGTISKITSSATIVNIVYENIPTAIQDAKTRSFKYVGTGPVTPNGRDYDPNIDGAAYIPQGKYYQKGPPFYGLADGTSTNGVQSLRGNATPQTMITAQNINGAGSAAGPNGAGVIANQFNNKVWEALGDEYNLKQGFYNATKVVDFAFQNHRIGDNELAGPIDRANLINFLTDGYLPTGETDKLNGKENASIRKDAYGYQLKIARHGLQILNQMNVGISDETIKSVQDLLNKYKADGGKKEYDDVINYLPKPKK